MAQRVTIRDIAAEANTSITAVSLTLNNKPNRLSAATKEHIRAVAKRLHYVPNQSARNLVSHRSMLLGLIVPDIENAYFASLAKRLGDECAVHGYALIISNSNDSASVERQLIKQFSERGLDGILLVPSLGSFDNPEDFKKTVTDVDRPVMLIDRISAYPWCDTVGFDNFTGGSLVARYLLARGHQRIGLIAARSQHTHNDGRIQGFLHAMSEAGQTVPARRIVEGGFRYSGGYEAVDRLLAEKVTAIFCGNDLSALGARKRLMELGKKIPADVSLVGYDNSMAAQGMGADLTTVGQNITLLATKAVATLLDRIQVELEPSPDPSPIEKPWLAEPHREMFPPKLLERATVTRLVD